MSAEAQGTENTEPDNLNVGLIATVTIVGALLVVSIAAALTALVRSEASSYGYEVGAFADLGTVKRLKQEQRAKLEAAPAKDKEKGTISIPVERAMTAVTTEIQKDPSSATETPPAAAPTAAAPTGDATPAEEKPADQKDEKNGSKDKKDKADKGKSGSTDKADPHGAPVVPAMAPAK